MTDPIHNFRPVFSQSPPLQHKVTFGGLHFGAAKKTEGDGKAGDGGDKVEIKQPTRRKREKKAAKDPAPEKGTGGNGDDKASNASLAGTIFADPTEGTSKGDRKTGDAVPPVTDKPGPEDVADQNKTSPPADNKDTGKTSETDKAGQAPPAAETGETEETGETDKAPPAEEAEAPEEKKKRGAGFYVKSAIYTAAILGLTLLSFGVIPVATILGLQAGSGVAATIALGVGAAFLRDSLQRKYGAQEGKEFENYIKKEKVMVEISNWVRKALKRIAAIKVPIFGWSLLSPEKQEEWVNGRMETYHNKFEDKIRSIIDRFYDDNIDPEDREAGEEDLNKFSEWRTNKGVFYAVVAYAGLKARHILVKQLPAQILRLRNKGWYGFILAAALTFLAEAVFKVKLDKNKKPDDPPPETNNTRMNPQFA